MVRLCDVVRCNVVVYYCSLKDSINVAVMSNTSIIINVASLIVNITNYE